MSNRIAIDFTGYLTVEKDDIVITTIDEKTGHLNTVDTKNLTKEEIIHGLNFGEYYLSFERTYEKAIDGETKIAAEEDED